MSKLPIVSMVVELPSEVLGQNIVLRTKKATARGDHLEYIEQKVLNGVYPGQTSPYPYKRFRVSAPDGTPIFPRQRYSSVLVTACAWPSDLTFPFSDEVIAEKIPQDLAEFARRLTVRA